MRGPYRRVVTTRVVVAAARLRAVAPAASVMASTVAAWTGPRQRDIEEKLTAALQPTHLDVVNESHGRREDESHFFACVISDAFEKKKPLERHRMVMAVLSENGALPFHALRIAAKTPTEWAANGAVPAAPKCAGGDGRGMLR
mmetsp:Transcript_12565/g.50506  ORF Transcript_12565/g.50506 Transcript_12565/m.50506 type:complete len:143 (+) Transcript_12565:68-496(+)